MACTAPAGGPIEYWTAYEFVDGVVCYFGDSFGVTAFMLIFFGITMIGLYNSTGSMMLPLIIMIALGPLVMFLLPGFGIQAVAVVAIMGSGIGGYWIWQRLQ